MTSLGGRSNSPTSSGLESSFTSTSDGQDDYLPSDEPTPLLERRLETALPLRLSLLVSNRTLCVFRISASLFYLSYILWRLSVTGIVYIWWFTDWNWILNLVYFASATALSLIPNPYRIHSRLHKHLFSAILPISILVSLTFWLIIVWELPSHLWEREKFDLITGHSLNLLFPFIELLLNNITIGFSHSLSANLFLITYELFILTLRINGFTLGRLKWPYPFLDKFAETEDQMINYGGLVFIAILFSLAISSMTALSIYLVRKRNFYFANEIHA